MIRLGRSCDVGKCTTIPNLSYHILGPLLFRDLGANSMTDAQRVTRFLQNKNRRGTSASQNNDVLPVSAHPYQRPLNTVAEVERVRSIDDFQIGRALPAALDFDA